MEKFLNSNLNINKISIACLVPKNSGAPVHKNRSFHGFAFYPSGESYFIFDNNKKFHVKANDIIYLPKHSNYVVESIIADGCYAINWDISDIVDFAPFLFKTKSPSFYLEEFKKAESVWKRKNTGYEMECKSHLYHIICNMIKEYKTGYISKSKTGVLQPALDFIHAEYLKDNISIPYLADLCGISEIYFRKIFRQAKGVSPLKYINQLKLERAKELLSLNMYTVSQVAEFSGYHDESYFSREFKRIMGKSPKEFANTNLL